MFNALDELFARTQENDELECFFLNSNMFIFDLEKVETDEYIIDGIGDYPESEWKYIRGDFRIFMNGLFRMNGYEYWRW